MYSHLCATWLVSTLLAAAAVLRELSPRSNAHRELDKTQHDFLLQVVELLNQLTVLQLQQKGMMADATVQALLGLKQPTIGPPAYQEETDINPNASMATASDPHPNPGRFLDVDNSQVASLSTGFGGKPDWTHASRVAEHGKQPTSHAKQGKAIVGADAAELPGSTASQVTSNVRWQPIGSWTQPSTEEWADVEACVSATGMQFIRLMLGSESDSMPHRQTRYVLLKGIAKLLAILLAGTSFVVLLTTLCV